MANIVIRRTVDLSKVGKTEFLSGTLFSQENQAHTFLIDAKQDGEPVTLTGAVTGSFIRPDGGTVTLEGEIVDGAASVTLPQACYVLTGRFALTVFVSVDGAKVAVYSAAGNVKSSFTGTIVDPGNVVPDVNDIVAEYATMRQAVEECEEATAAITEIAESINDNQIVVETESAAIAHVEDAARAKLKALEVEITAVQAGSGDPSPTNIRPISGWTSVGVTRTGKNLLDESAAKTSSSNWWIGANTSNGVPDGSLVLKAGTYTLSVSDMQSGIYVIGETGTGIRSVYNQTSVTFTVPTTQSVKVLLYKAGGTIDYWQSVNVQLELGSTATDYEPYSSASATYTLPQEAGTVYGGKLRINEDGSGSLVVNRASVVVNGSETWEKPDNCFRTLSIHSDSDFPNAVSSVYPVATSYAGVNGQNNRIAIGTAWLRIHDERFSTVSDFTAYLSENNVQLVYELATPVTYTLTAQQVLSLIKGTNNVYADTGDTAIEYVADTKTYIDNKFAELQALILENV